MFLPDARRVCLLLRYHCNTPVFPSRILRYEYDTYQLWNIIAFYSFSLSESVFKVIIALCESSDEQIFFIVCSIEINLFTRALAYEGECLRKLLDAIYPASLMSHLWIITAMRAKVDINKYFIESNQIRSTKDDILIEISWWQWFSMILKEF